jgi:hypothetical protein
MEMTHNESFFELVALEHLAFGFVSLLGQPLSYNYHPTITVFITMLVAGWLLVGQASPDCFLASTSTMQPGSSFLHTMESPIRCTISANKFQISVLTYKW